MSKKGSLEFKATTGLMRADWLDEEAEVTIELGEYVQIGPFIFSDGNEIDEFASFIKERLKECFE